jgi:hypothetical protein
MIVNGWSPWIWITVLKVCNVVLVVSDLEPLGHLPVTVLKTFYQHIKLSYVCHSGVTLVLSDAQLPGIVSPLWEDPSQVRKAIGLSQTRQTLYVEGWHSQILSWNHASCGVVSDLSGTCHII